MTEQLRKPGIGERLTQLAYLLKHTFTIVGRDPGILRPWVRMAVYSIIMASLFFLAIFAFVLGSNGIGAMLIAASVLMFIYKFFYFVRQEMRQSWLVTEALKGERRSAAEAKARIKSLIWTCRKIALIDLAVAWMLNMARRSGKAGMLVRLLMRGIEEVWDLVNHYLLPSAAVDGLGIRESIGQMHRLKDNVPETLAGVFGIDIAGRAVGTIMGPIYFLLIVGSLALGLWLGEALPAFYAGDIAAWLEHPEPLPETLHFNWLPLLLALWAGKIGSVILERVTTSVKVIYFSIFYMRITHLEAIVPEIREQLDSYLRMEAEDPEPVTPTS